MKHYELLSILPGTMTETEAQEVAGQIKETIEKSGGESITLSYNGKSRLAYPMKHIRYGYFFVLRFAATEANVQKFRSKLLLMNQILRNLLQIHNPNQAVELNFNEPTSTPVETESVATPVVAVETAAPIAEETIEEVTPEPVQTEEAAPVAEAKPAKTTKKAKTEVSMEEIDQKLDELLEKDV